MDEDEQFEEFDDEQKERDQDFQLVVEVKCQDKKLVDEISRKIKKVLMSYSDKLPFFHQKYGKHEIGGMDAFLRQLSNGE